jgi:hypothetical protein
VARVCYVLVIIKLSSAGIEYCTRVCVLVCVNGVGVHVCVS